MASILEILATMQKMGGKGNGMSVISDWANNLQKDTANKSENYNKKMDSGFYAHGHPADHGKSMETKGSPDCKKSASCRDNSKFCKM